MPRCTQRSDRSAVARRGSAFTSRRFGCVAVALVPVGALTATIYLSDSDHSAPEGEYVFFQPLLGQTGFDDPVELNRSNPVFTLHIADFEQMMDDLDPELAEGKVVAMDSLQGFPLLFTEHPKQFLVPEDRDFEQDRERPDRPVRLRGPPAERQARRRPDHAAAGDRLLRARGRFVVRRGTRTSARCTSGCRRRSSTKAPPPVAGPAPAPRSRGDGVGP